MVEVYVIHSITPPRTRILLVRSVYATHDLLIHGVKHSTWNKGYMRFEYVALFVTLTYLIRYSWANSTIMLYTLSCPAIREPFEFEVYIQHMTFIHGVKHSTWNEGSLLSSWLLIPCQIPNSTISLSWWLKLQNTSILYNTIFVRDGLFERTSLIGLIGPTHHIFSKIL